MGEDDGRLVVSVSKLTLVGVVQVVVPGVACVLAEESAEPDWGIVGESPNSERPPKSGPFGGLGSEPGGSADESLLSSSVCGSGRLTSFPKGGFSVSTTRSSSTPRPSRP